MNQHKNEARFFLNSKLVQSFGLNFKMRLFAPKLTHAVFPFAQHNHI